MSRSQPSRFSSTQADELTRLARHFLFGVSGTIRSLPGMAHVPIVTLTAYAMVDDRERCLAAGMDAYLTKPLDLCELIEVVEETASDATAKEQSAVT